MLFILGAHSRELEIVEGHINAFFNENAEF